MNQVNRRGFLKRTAAATAGSYLALSSWDRLVPSARGANDEIRLAVAGIRGRGDAHVGDFMKLQGVKVVALCDPDKQVMEQRIASFRQKYNVDDSEIKGYADVRHILDRKDVDALVIAAPNHWHSLMTVWACQAGKHVYVEKPVSHAIWEGRKMVEASRESMKSCEDAANTLKDILEQLDGNGVDPAKQPFVLGPLLTYDRKQERFVGPNAEEANKYLKCSYREPFVVPEQV